MSQSGAKYLQVQYLHIAAHAHAHHGIPGRARTLKENEPVLVSQVSVTLVSTSYVHPLVEVVDTLQLAV